MLAQKVGDETQAPIADIRAAKRSILRAVVPLLALQLVAELMLLVVVLVR